jgi:thymidine kinase
MANHKEMVFYFGTMGSRKSLELMLDQFRRQEKMHHETLIVKPKTDDRSGGVYTRAFGGEEREALVMSGDAEATEFLLGAMHEKIGSQAIDSANWTLYLDELNFYTPEQITSIRRNIVNEDIADVNLYGLLNDSFGNEFPATRTALMLADRIVQLDNICDNNGCDRIAVWNARVRNGEVERTGDQVAVEKPGVNYKYLALCDRDYAAGVVNPRKQ